MPKRAMSFKPTSECEVQLAGLMDRWKCDRTAALIKAVAICHENCEVVFVADGGALPARPVGPQPEILPGHDGENVSTEPTVKPKVLPKDPKAVAEMVAENPPPNRVTGTQDTRSQQKRMDDFYRSNMAKGKK